MYSSLMRDYSPNVSSAPINTIVVSIDCLSFCCAHLVYYSFLYPLGNSETISEPISRSDTAESI